MSFEENELPWFMQEFMANFWENSVHVRPIHSSLETGPGLNGSPVGFLKP